MSTLERLELRCQGPWHDQGRWGHGTGTSGDRALYLVTVECPAGCGYQTAVAMCDGRVDFNRSGKMLRPSECPDCHHIAHPLYFWPRIDLLPGRDAAVALAEVPPVPDLIQVPADAPHIALALAEPEVVPDLLEAVTEPAEVAFDVLAAFDRRNAARLGPRTQRARLRLARAILERIGDPMTVTTDELEADRAARARQVGPEQLKSDRRVTVELFTMLHERGLIAQNPAAGLPPVHIPAVQGRIALDSQVRAGLRKADAHERAMLLLARYAGLRLSEICGLQLAHREGDYLRFPGKGGVVRRVAIADDLAAALDAIEPQSRDGWYFPGRFTGHLNAEGVSKRIHRLTGTNPHSLRHAAATAAYAATRDIEAVRRMLGHSSLATTQRYLHVTDDQLRAVAAGTAIQEDA